MLSDEEKKALKELTEIKELVEEDLKYKDYEVAATLDQIDLESLVTILNLIKKQSKEIEEYKKQLDLDYVDKHFVPIERYNQLEKEIEELKEDNKHQWEERCKLTFELENSTSNDKIKAKIDELDKQEEDLQNSISNISWELMDIQIRREVLQSLLEKEGE